jgi:hypothetical protein
MLVGFCGIAQSGKDTAASLLVQRHGFERRAFADPMRDMLYAINPRVIHYNVDGSPIITTVQQLVDDAGWEFAKKSSDVRSLLQRLGTEGGREILGENIWVETLFKKKYNNLVISDVRFPNEAAEIHRRNGIIIRVVRGGVELPNQHHSETAYDNQDYTIVNDGTLDTLYKMLYDILSYHENIKLINSSS